MVHQFPCLFPADLLVGLSWNHLRNGNFTAPNIEQRPSGKLTLALKGVATEVPPILPVFLGAKAAPINSCRACETSSSGVRVGTGILKSELIGHAEPASTSRPTLPVLAKSVQQHLGNQTKEFSTLIWPNSSPTWLGTSHAMPLTLLGTLHGADDFNMGTKVNNSS